MVTEVKNTDFQRIQHVWSYKITEFTRSGFVTDHLSMVTYHSRLSTLNSWFSHESASFGLVTWSTEVVAKWFHKLKKWHFQGMRIDAETPRFRSRTYRPTRSSRTSSSNFIGFESFGWKQVHLSIIKQWSLRLDTIHWVEFFVQSRPISLIDFLMFESKKYWLIFRSPTAHVHFSVAFRFQVDSTCDFSPIKAPLLHTAFRCACLSVRLSNLNLFNYQKGAHQSNQNKIRSQSTACYLASSWFGTASIVRSSFGDHTPPFGLTEQEREREELYPDTHTEESHPEDSQQEDSRERQ